MENEAAFRIVTIQRQKQKKIQLTLEDGETLCLHEEAVYGSALQEGTVLAQAQLERLYLDSQRRFARQRAINLLAAQQTTCKRLLDKLLERFEPSIAQETVERMCELGLLNDREYAQKLAQDLYHLRHFGQRRIENELTSRGIERELASEVVEQLDFDAPDRLQELVQRRFGDKLLEEKGRRRAIAALLRMGYSYDEIRRAIEDALQNKEG